MELDLQKVVAALGPIDKSSVKSFQNLEKKVIELEKVSGFTIDQLISFFASGKIEFKR